MKYEETYDNWKDDIFLTYLAKCDFRFLQNGNEFKMFKGYGDYNNWYYLLHFVIENNSKIKCHIKYNHDNTNNKYTYEFVKDIILPSINEYIKEFENFNKNKIKTFCVKLIYETPV